LNLGGANTYTGNTAVNAGTLALNGGSIGASAVTVASTATLANATTNIGPIGGTTTLNSGAFATFTGIGGSPSVIGKISVTGNLNLNGNALTINVSGAALAAGAYRLLDCTGTLSGTANPTPTLSGTPLPGGYTASISTTAGSAGHVDLVVQGTTPVFSNLATNPSAIYGTAAILLSGTVSAPGPVYPTNGETITVTINSNTQPTTINDGTGDFSISYNLSALSASGAPYIVTYMYSGDGLLNATSSTNSTFTLNPLPTALTGTRLYDGTTTAAAGILTVTNKIGSDVVTVASGSGTLSSASVGTNPISSFGTLVLGGAAAGNYTLAGASGLVTITTPPFSIMSGSVDVSGTNFIITWQSAPGATYHVVGSGDPTIALSNWATVAGPIIATGTNTSVTNPIASSMSVFDVISP
jgi:autotransporter-associated beta strand protein